MFKALTLVSLLYSALPALASPCVTFDANFNLLALGLGGKDWNAGTQDSWTSGQATDITATGRPPFDGTNTTCYLAQFFNAVYVMNGDASDPSSVYIYNAAAKSWSKQEVTTGGFSPASFNAILDHDTNVFYALSNGELYFLDFGEMTSANSTALAWVDVGKAPYPAGYNPVMALAQNHIHFLDVPGNQAGEADIFVIHFSYFQPQAQSYPAASGNTFPEEHGLTASFFQTSGVQQEFAFVPDDGSATFVINVENNSTTPLAGPSSKDPNSNYAASITALVQLDSTGAVSFLPYQQGNAATNQAAKWTSVSAISAVVPPGSISSNSSSSASSGAPAATGASGSSAPSASKTGASGSASGSPSPSTGSDASQQTGGALAMGVGHQALGFMAAGALALSGFLL